MFNRGMKALYRLPSCLVAPWLRISCHVSPWMPVGLPSLLPGSLYNSSVVAPLLPFGSVLQGRRVLVKHELLME